MLRRLRRRSTRNPSSFFRGSPGERRPAIFILRGASGNRHGGSLLQLHQYVVAAGASPHGRNAPPSGVRDNTEISSGNKALFRLELCSMLTMASRSPSCDWRTTGGPYTVAMSDRPSMTPVSASLPDAIEMKVTSRPGFKANATLGLVIPATDDLDIGTDPFSW